VTLLDLHDDEKRKLEAKKAQVASPAPTTDVAQQSVQSPTSGAPLSTGGALNVQTLAGNGAMNSLVGQPSPQQTQGSRSKGQARGQHTPTVQRDVGDEVDTGMQITDQTTSVMNTGVSIGTSANVVGSGSSTSSQLGTGGAGIGAGIVGLTSVVETVRSGQKLGEAREGLKKAKEEERPDPNDPSGQRKIKGNKIKMRAFDRKVNSSGGDVAQNSSNVVGSVSGITTGSIGVAGTLAQTGSALSTAGNVAGVVGATITLPIQILSLVRNSRRAELQRQRMNRLTDTAKQTTITDKIDTTKLKTDSSQLKQRKQGDLDGAKTERDTHKQTVEGIQTSLTREEAELKVRQTNVDLLTEQVTQAETSNKQLHDQYAGVGPNGEEIPENQRPSEVDILMNTQALDEIRDSLTQAKKSLTEQTTTVDGLKTHLEQEKTELGTHEQTVSGLGEEVSRAGESETRGETLEKDMSQTGQLDDAGKQDTKMPSLKEIADYAEKKNSRGFGRRTIGAVAAGVGVAAGAIGLAAGIEALKGNNGLAGDLGIAGAVIGGLAALGGLAVAAWKIHSWRKKRKAQAAKMKAGGKTVEGTYNPFKSNVDQKTERRHMATALISYAQHGSEGERTEANRILTALDPKGSWAEKDTTGKAKGLDQGEMTDDARKVLLDHVMDKMGSGG
jgi:hypothetical protein